MASNSGGGSAPAAAEVSPAKPLVLRESELGLTTSSRTQSLPVVQPAKKPSTGQLPTAQALLQPPITTQREPVVKLVEQNVPERRVSAEPLVQVPLRTVASRPLLRLADAEPLLAVLQPPSSATELPPPPDGTTTVDPPADSEELVDAFLVSKSIHELSTRITPEAGDLPKDYAAARFAREDNIPHPMGYSRTEVETLKTWEAPALCYRPLYFEDINLERYGYKLPLIQPALSAAHFFGRVPLLPYLMVSEGHFRCQYALGHYRPGDYAPYSLYIPRLRLDASAAEAAVAAAAILIVP